MMERLGSAARVPSVIDDLEYARSHMVVRPASVPPAVIEPDEPSRFALASLPWTGRDARLLGKPLSPREVEVLALIRDGATNKQAAFELGISEQTVKNQMSSILAKLGASDRTAAVIKAASAGDLLLPVQPASVLDWMAAIETRLVGLRGSIDETLARLRDGRAEAMALLPPPETVAEPEVAPAEPKVRKPRGQWQQALVEAVDPDGIVRTGSRQRDACGRGHRFTLDNTTLFGTAGMLQRQCKACSRNRLAARRRDAA
jgi:DNA-binding CsgD family transcriptional regulator